ncbi:MAG: sodium:solute symporter [Crocinitomicaceae bacterium]
MSPTLILSVFIAYFFVLIGISYLTSKGANNETFFVGNRNSKWYLVAFGMIGASLSGVTFISIPGTILGSKFTYMQMAIGYIIGYAIIAFVLLPLYYRMNLTSIYTYLKSRFGDFTYKTGATFFLVSRIIGASLRLFLVADILQVFVFDAWNVPFWITVSFSILMIWLYTFRGGIKTIIWTDSLQTLFMLASLMFTIYLICSNLNISIGSIFTEIENANLGSWFQTDNPDAGNYWWKGILGGMFITIGMTGLDQDMMQKNLSCKNIGEAKKNMMTFSFVLFFVNLAFLIMGALLYLYFFEHPDSVWSWAQNGAKTDRLFATFALDEGLGMGIGIIFLLGLTAAVYSSADSALTSLTTSFCIDILDIEKKNEEEQKKTRLRVHVLMSLILLVTIMIFSATADQSIIWKLFGWANLTYGPLLGLFFFGILTKRRVYDQAVPFLCILSPVIIYFLNENSKEWFDGYQFGFELLGINGLLTFFFLWILSFIKPMQGNPV